ncbi:MAG TPA: SDR family NAD(P)-dependent oxidoreductase [Usitatibacter sp.]|nr:SDR family NAD(P)-dependent oxidoreductase [Usitatibacter sp.]
MVVGASAGLGRALAQALASRGHDLFLVASDERDLRALSSHLRQVYGVQVEHMARAISAAPGWAHEVGAAAQRGGVPDHVLFPVGGSRDDDAGGLADTDALDILGVNLVGVMHLAAELLPAMTRAGRGSLVGFGSIAGARGRSRNVAYSAAKSALRTYFESLRHLGAAHGIEVQFYVLGYMATQQSYGKRLPLPVASPDAVARAIVDALGHGSRVRHLPAFWGPVEWLLRAMPFAIFRKIKS